MSNVELLTIQTLDVYVVAKEFARRVHVARIQDTELRDQATRAAKSAFLQVCEGLPHRKAAMGRRYFVAANASVCETLGAVDLAGTLGVVQKGDAEQIDREDQRDRRLVRHGGRRYQGRRPHGTIGAAELGARWTDALLAGSGARREPTGPPRLTRRAWRAGPEARQPERGASSAPNRRIFARWRTLAIGGSGVETLAAGAFNPSGTRCGS
jgi:four helix bundle protein